MQEYFKCECCIWAFHIEGEGFMESTSGAARPGGSGVVMKAG